MRLSGRSLPSWCAGDATCAVFDLTRSTASWSSNCWRWPISRRRSGSASPGASSWSKPRSGGRRSGTTSLEPTRRPSTVMRASGRPAMRGSSSKGCRRRRSTLWSARTRRPVKVTASDARRCRKPSAIPWSRPSRRRMPRRASARSRATPTQRPHWLRTATKPARCRAG